MGKTIKLGTENPCIFSIKVNGYDEDAEPKVNLVTVNEKEIICGDTGKTTPELMELVSDYGLEVEMDIDELAQAVSYLGEATEGKTTVTHFLKSMLKTSDGILDDEMFEMAALLLKECNKRVAKESKLEKSVLTAAETVLQNFSENDW